MTRLRQDYAGRARLRRLVSRIPATVVVGIVWSVQVLGLAACFIVLAWMIAR